MRFSALERAVLLILLLAALYGFLRPFWRVMAIILRSKPDADFALTPVGPRLRRLFREVVAQRLVIGQRLWPGLAHAFVFWGFCLFALVTVNHFATAFGLAFLDRGGLYFRIVAVFAAAVAVSIAGLAARRFLVRPKWLEPLSPESGLIALLIFALMATYLVEFWRPGIKANWWAHTLAILAFLPLIPHSKHLHIALAPLAVFLKRDGFSAIPPLAGDEDFGLDTGKDVTRLVSLQAYSCVECGRCTEHCPAYNTGKTLNPKQIVLGVRAHLNEFGPAGDAPLVGRHLSMEAAFECTTCGACEFQCPVGVQHLPVIVGLRRGAVNTGKWEDSYGTGLFLKLERYGNALGFPASERENFVQKSGLAWFDGSQEYCLWLGCMGAYDPRGREIVIALTGVLRHFGVTFGVLRRERCSGDAARRLGNDLLFAQLAEQNLEHICQSGVKKMLSICPHCVRTIGTDWREAGGTVPIEHHSELLARLGAGLAPNRTNGQTVVYHDACYLGRYRGTYDQPRAMIERHTELVEPERARERGFCCGAGGGLAFLGEEKGQRVNRERAAQLLATGAGTVAAACPFCNTMLRDGLAAIAAEPPELLDIAQIAAAGLTR
jgi:Fe-S oxidoreductase